ncbi:M48 family metallopeptidase [Sphingobacterium corticis]|uniref:M48 family metallopeptidase n=1 Tax=Sphingobacterium corticis TaxID=1812823 RepID=A0ABW5NNX9_9SPHI
MKKLFKYVPIVLASAVLVGCATSAITGRRYLRLVDSETINQQAAVAYKEFLGTNSSKVVTGTSQATMVKNVGNKIALATQKFLTERGIADKYNFNWEFNLVESPDVNAWCMPGGKVAVYTGILPITANEAGLATVMGHEIAHAIEEHSVAQASNQMALQLGGAVVGGAAQISRNKSIGVFNSLYGIGGNLGMLKFSRNDELAADKAGIIIMALAGYDPNEAVNFWSRMANAKSGQSQPEFLSTHPSDARRISQLESLVPEAMKYYKK